MEQGVKMEGFDKNKKIQLGKEHVIVICCDDLPKKVIPILYNDNKTKFIDLNTGKVYSEGGYLDHSGFTALLHDYIEEETENWIKSKKFNPFIHKHTTQSGKEYSLERGGYSLISYYIKTIKGSYLKSWDYEERERNRKEKKLVKIKHIVDLANKINRRLVVRNAFIKSARKVVNVAIDARYKCRDIKYAIKERKEKEISHFK